MAKKFIIGIDLGGTNLKIALFTQKYKIIDKETLSTRRFVAKQRLIEAIINSIQGILKKNKLPKQSVAGIGLGLPGPIDVKKGVVRFFPNIPGFTDVPLKAILQKRLRLPVFLDNDANLMCLAEYKRGAAAGARNAVCITLGTGVGGGIIIEGRLYRGSSFAAGEIGHVPLNETGRKCNCSGVACLETYIGNSRILKDAKKIFKRNISLEDLSRLANKGDTRAKHIWVKVGERLGIVLAGVINVLNPDCVVIGGGIANAGKVLFDTVRATVKKRAMSVQSKRVKIVKTRLSNNAGMIGAALLANKLG